MPTFPVTRARTANLALMVQPDGMARSSGNSTRVFRDPCRPGTIAEQGAVLFAVAEFLRVTKHPFQIPLRSSLALGLVFLEPSLGRRFEVQGKALADQQLVQARRFTRDGANAEMPFPEVPVRTEILAVDRASADQFCQLVARIDAAAPGIGVVVDAHLVELRRIDAVEPVGEIAKLDGVAVPDHGARGEG